MDQSAWTADVVRKYRVRQPRNCPSAPLRRAAAPCRLLRPRAQDRGGTDRARGCRSSSAHGAPDSAQDQRGRPQDGPEALSNPERHERLPAGRPRPRPPCPSRRTDRIRWTHPAGSWRSGGAPGLRTEDLRAAPWCPGSSSSRRAGRRGRARAHRGQGGPRGAIGARQGRPLLGYYARILPVSLDALKLEERNRVYRMLDLKVLAHEDGGLEATWALLGDPCGDNELLPPGRSRTPCR